MLNCSARVLDATAISSLTLVLHVSCILLVLCASRYSLFTSPEHHSKRPTRLYFQWHKQHCARRGAYLSRAIWWTWRFLFWIINVVLFVRGNCGESSSSFSVSVFFISIITMFSWAKHFYRFKKLEKNYSDSVITSFHFVIAEEVKN